MCYWCFCFSRRRRDTRFKGDWSSDVCSSDLTLLLLIAGRNWAIQAVRAPHLPRLLRWRHLTAHYCLRHRDLSCRLRRRTPLTRSWFGTCPHAAQLLGASDNAVDEISPTLRFGRSLRRTPLAVGGNFQKLELLANSC